MRQVGVFAVGVADEVAEEKGVFAYALHRLDEVGVEGEASVGGGREGRREREKEVVKERGKLGLFKT